MLVHAQSPDLQLSIDLATLNAKYTLADRINGKLDAMMKTFVSRLGTDDDVSASTMSEVEKVTKNVIASVDVAGYNPKRDGDISNRNTVSCICFT